MLCSCSSYVYEREAESKKVRIDKIAVLPFYITSSVDREILGLIENDFSTTFYRKIKDYGFDNLTVYTPEESSDVFSSLMLSGSESGYIASALEKSSELGLNVVLIGIIRDIRQRVGSDYGVSSPSGIDIEVGILDVESRKIVWSARYSELQIPLLSDVSNLDLFIKRKGRWVTVQEISNDAVEKIFERLADYLRT